MQLLSLSCVICISGEPRRYTQRASERNRVRGGGRERERETLESDGERKGKGLRSRGAKGGKEGAETLSRGNPYDRERVLRRDKGVR